MNPIKETTKTVYECEVCHKIWLTEGHAISHWKQMLIKFKYTAPKYITNKKYQNIKAHHDWEVEHETR